MRATDLFEQTLAELSMPTTRDRAEIIMARAGYRIMGRGSHGNVMHKEGADYVVKLFDSKDRAYLDFIAFVRANPNPHFPKFIGKPVEITPDYFAIRTEKLDLSSIDVSDVEHLQRYVTNVRDYGYAREDAREYVTGLPPEFKTALDLLAGFLKKHDSEYFCDIHNANLMMRGSTVVISDPVAVTGNLVKDINESAVRVFGNKYIRLLTGKSQLLKLLAQSQIGALRGWVTSNGEVWVWDAMDWSHGWAGRHVFNAENPVYFWSPTSPPEEFEQNGGRETVIDCGDFLFDATPWQREKQREIVLAKSPVLAKLIGNR
jgi:hypothetical protein